MYLKYIKKTEPRALTFMAVKKDIEGAVRVRGEVANQREYNLSFAAGGTVREVTTREGAEVQENDILIQLDTRDLDLEKNKLQSQLRQAEAGVRSSRAQLTQTQAALASQQAKLQDIKNGTSAEELALAQTNKENAKASLDAARVAYTNAQDLASKQLIEATKTRDNAKTYLEDIKSKAATDLTGAYSGVQDTIADAYAKASDAISKQTNELFVNTGTSNPKLAFNTANSQAQTDVESLRVTAGFQLDAIKKSLDTLTVGHVVMDTALSDVARNLSGIRDFLVRLNDALNSASGLSPTTITTYKGYVSAAITGINAALSSVNTKQDAIVLQKQINQNAINTANAQYESAQKALDVQQSSNTATIARAQDAVTSANSALKVANDQYAIKKAGATLQAIRAQEEAVKQAEAGVRSQQSLLEQAMAAGEVIRAQIAQIAEKIERAVLRAPAKSTVLSIKAEKGEVVSPGQQVIALSAEGYKIQADISELEIGRIHATNGNAVRVVFDAYPGQQFSGSVLSVDPQEVIKEGDSYYRVNIGVEVTSDTAIRSAMKADLQITTAQKKGVVTVPEIAITKKDEKKYVRLRSGTQDRDVEVTTGVSDGTDIEIVSGVQEGDIVVISGE